MAKRTEPMLNIYFTSGGFLVDDMAPGDEVIHQWAERFQADRCQALYDLALAGDAPWISPALHFLTDLTETLFQSIGRQGDLELSREAVQAPLDPETADEILARLPFALGMEHVNGEWIQSLWLKLLEIFRSRIKAWDGTVARYFLEHQTTIGVVGRVFFHLVERAEDPQRPFAFLATYSTKPPRSKRAVHTPLKNALEEFQGEDEKLLALIRSVIQAAEASSLVKGLMESGELFRPIGFTADEAYQFLKELPVYEEAGIMCRIPDWWRRKRNSLRVQVKIGDQEPSRVGLDAILDFSPELCIGTDRISPEELRRFLTMAEGLIQYKGKWIEVDHQRIEEVLQAFAELERGSAALTLAEAIQLELDPSDVLDGHPDVDLSISNGKWLTQLKNQLISPELLPGADVPDTFRADLRPYQETGYRWLRQMNSLKLGACLADDMGLGKTVQILALLESLRLEGKGPVLLILPASLIGNWVSELERFAPEMPFQVLHPSEADGTDIQSGRFLYLSTYQMAVRLPKLAEISWDCLILDEAQAIRNPSTKQTKAIKAIPARQRLALTGTPIENRLSDLWSLFDFLDPGLLGTAKEFTAFSKKLKDAPEGYLRLRRMIQPFLLRRLKTDRTIIRDLPEKFEINDYTTLSKRQIALYQQLVRELEKNLASSEGIARKGLVLASLMKFKQICNHPDHYLGKEDFKAEQSGKFELLGEICETIRDKRERVLVFTQFQEMTGPLSDYLGKVFGRPGLVLHGGTPVKQRKDLVETFNGESWVPFMVLSLKAGGVGLNLTGANHVIHFDRWWNPAVESQATDRAYRIGQKKDVLVHKFVTRGTIEEKIDELIQSKQKLSQDVLAGGGEAWISEYSNEELLKLFTLGGDLQ